MMRKKMFLPLILSAAVLSACGASTAQTAETTQTEAAQTEAPVTQDTVRESGGADTESTPEETLKPSCDDVARKVIESGEFPEMASIDREDLKSYMDADIPEGTDFALYLCASGGFSDEVFIVSLEGVDGAAIDEAAQKRIGQRYTDFEDYAPDEAEKLNNTLVMEYNGYYMYFVAEDTDSAAQTAKEALT